MDINFAGPHSSVNFVKDYVIPLLGPPVAAATAFFVAAYQINKNAKIAREKDAEQLRNEMRKRFFDEIEVEISKLSNALLEFKSKCYHLKIVMEGPQFGPVRLINVTATEFHSAKSAVVTGVADVAISIEKYDIVLENADVLRHGLLAFGSDLNRFDGTMVPLLVENLPIRVHAAAKARMPKSYIYDEGEDIFRKSIGPDDMLEITNKISLLLSFADNIAAGIHDIRIDLQNTLLGPLFGRALPLREPLDPNSIILTTRPDRAQNVRNALENTEFHRSHVEAMANAREAIRRRDDEK